VEVRALEIGVDRHDVDAGSSEQRREVCGKEGLADAPLTAGDGDDVSAAFARLLEPHVGGNLRFYSLSSAFQ
jgi:hypothetical protein